MVSRTFGASATDERALLNVTSACFFCASCKRNKWFWQGNLKKVRILKFLTFSLQTMTSWLVNSFNPFTAQQAMIITSDRVFTLRRRVANIHKSFWEKEGEGGKLGSYCLRVHISTAMGETHYVARTVWTLNRVSYSVHEICVFITLNCTKPRVNKRVRVSGITT